MQMRGASTDVSATTPAPAPDGLPVEPHLWPCWAGCLADPGAIDALHKEAGLQQPKLRALSRIYSAPDDFVAKVTAVATAEGVADKVGELDLLMIYHMLTAEVVPVPMAPVGPAVPVVPAPAAAPGPAVQVQVPPQSIPGSSVDMFGLTPPSTPPPGWTGSSPVDRETEEGKRAGIRMANLLGVTALSVLLSQPDDPPGARQLLLQKAVSKRASDGGGAVLKALNQGEVQFDEHMTSLVTWLGDLDPPMMYAVARIQHVRAQAPPWKAGGKEYHEKYLMRHAFVYPVRFDQELQTKAHNKALSTMVSKLGDLKRLDEARAQMDGISAQLAALGDGGVNWQDGGSDGTCALQPSGHRAAHQCSKCLEDDHTVKNCPHSSEVASKLRKAYVNGQKAGHKKASAAAAQADGN